MIEPIDYNDRISRYKWKRTLSIAPRKCGITKCPIPPLSYAYKGTRLVTVPGTPVLMVNWLSPVAYLIEKIKGNIK